MLNYIWAGLIIFSLVFALFKDVRDLANDTYRNRQDLAAVIQLEPGANPDAASNKVKVTVQPGVYRSFFGLAEAAPAPAEAYAATMLVSPKGRELKFAPGPTFPAPLATIQEITGTGDDKTLTAVVTRFDLRDPAAANAAVRFNPVLFATMKRITAAAIDSAKAAVTLAIGLIGVLALWMGLMRIAETAGLINLVVRVTEPALRHLFPEIPRGHPAMGLVALNLTANMLGLGNAATPFGLRAMEELQKLNKTVDTATNSMVMLLAMNTAGVQIVPPAMLFAVMGLRATELVFPVLLSTGLSLVVAIIAAKLLGKLRRYRADDPELIAAPAPSAVPPTA